MAATVAGLAHEALVKREVDPLGLDCRVGEWRGKRRTTTSLRNRMPGDGRNVPNGADEAIVPVITSAAAGGIRCSLDAMLTWAGNWLIRTQDKNLVVR